MKNYCTPKIFLCRKVFTYIKISWFSNKDTPNKKTTIHIQKSKGKLPNEIYPKRLPFVTLDKFYLKTSMKKLTNISFVASIYVDPQIVYTKLLSPMQIPFLESHLHRTQSRVDLPVIFASIHAVGLQLERILNTSKPKFKSKKET